MPISSPSRCLPSNTPPSSPSALSLIYSSVFPMSQRSSPFPHPWCQISTHIDGSGRHVCNQRSRIRRHIKGPHLQFIYAAEPEIPCLPAVFIKLPCTICSCMACWIYFHFCYWGVNKQKYLLTKHFSGQPIHLPSLFQTWDGLSLMRIFPWFTTHHSQSWLVTS